MFNLPWGDCIFESIIEILYIFDQVNLLLFRVNDVIFLLYFLFNVIIYSSTLSGSVLPPWYILFSSLVFFSFALYTFFVLNLFMANKDSYF